MRCPAMATGRKSSLFSRIRTAARLRSSACAAILSRTLRFAPAYGLRRVSARFGRWRLCLNVRFRGWRLRRFRWRRTPGLRIRSLRRQIDTAWRVMLTAEAVCVGVGMVWLGGGLPALAALLMFWRYHAVSVKQFGGITGDLAGWFLAAGRAVHACRAGVFREVDGMIFITGPLYSGKRTYAEKLGGRQIADVQDLAADAQDLTALADELAARYDVVIATEIGGGVVPMDAGQRTAREAAGRLACLLAARADIVVEMFCGIPTALKGGLPC